MLKITYHQFYQEIISIYEKDNFINTVPYKTELKEYIKTVLIDIKHYDFIYKLALDVIRAKNQTNYLNNNITKE